jgi:hypothetical protein
MPINYLHLLSDADLDGLATWFSEADELFCRLEFPHSGGSGDSYLLSSVTDFTALLESVAWPELDAFLYRGQPFNIRGIGGEEVLNRAIGAIREGLWWAIVEPGSFYPSECKVLENGDSHAELEAAIAELAGKPIWIGLDPIENGHGDLQWVHLAGEAVYYLSVGRNRHAWAPDYNVPDKSRYRRLR